MIFNFTSGFNFAVFPVCEVQPRHHAQVVILRLEVSPEPLLSLLLPAVASKTVVFSFLCFLLGGLVSNF